MARLRPQPETRAVRSLSVVVTTLMVVLAIAALAGAASLRHVDLDWRAGLTNRWTVELPNPATGTQAGDPAPPGETAPAVDGPHAVAVLRAMPGILDATIVGPDEVARLLGPWLGDTPAIRELPLPTLIDLRLDPAKPPRFAAAEYQIATSLPGARLDDHGAWTGDLTRLARTGEVLGLVLFAIIALAATATIAVAARARLTINRAEIQLLHRIGASDFYIIRRFQIDAVRSAALGAVLGTLLAGGAGLVLLRKGAQFAPLLPRLRLEMLDWYALAAVPAGTVLIAMFVAWLTAWALVRRLP